MFTNIDKKPISSKCILENHVSGKRRDLKTEQKYK